MQDELQRRSLMNIPTRKEEETPEKPIYMSMSEVIECWIPFYIHIDGMIGTSGVHCQMANGIKTNTWYEGKSKAGK